MVCHEVRGMELVPCFTSPVPMSGGRLGSGQRRARLEPVTRVQGIIAVFADRRRNRGTRGRPVDSGHSPCARTRAQGDSQRVGVNA